MTEKYFSDNLEKISSLWNENKITSEEEIIMRKENSEQKQKKLEGLQEQKRLEMKSLIIEEREIQRKYCK